MAFIDVNKLSTIDKVVVGAGAVGLIALFLPWYGFSFPYGSASVSGFSAGYGLLGALLIVATGVYLGMLRSGASIPRMSIGPAVLTLGGSVIGAALVLLRWLFAGRVSYSLASYSYGPRFGMIIEVLAGIVQAACALTLFRRSGEELPWRESHTSET
jgi:hypothetical protein